MSKSNKLVHKSGKKNRKHGRAEDKCAAYKANGTREKNKVKKARKHLKRHPNDLVGREYVRDRAGP